MPNRNPLFCHRPTSPGHELFSLCPGSILISRNLDGNKFGAVAEITIRKAP